MEQKDKELLLKDLCARLPYKVYVNYDGGRDKQYEGILDDILPSRGEAYVEYCLCDIDDIRPYLRPLSSMTDEEKDEYTETFDITSPEVEDYDIFQVRMVDWLIEHHFDIRGLIEKGLALEATKEIYK